MRRTGSAVVVAFLSTAVVAAAAIALSAGRQKNIQTTGAVLLRSDEWSHRPVLARLSNDRRYARARDGSVASAHEIGVARLLTGHVDVAIGTLEAAVRQATKTSDLEGALRKARDPALLSDLAAAYLSRGRLDESPDAWRAAECAERAWRLARTPQIAWNRALTREGLHVRAEALIAWNEYLAIDGDSAWAAEAIEHVRRLTTPGRSRRWLQTKRPQSADANIVELVRNFPQEMRGHAEEELLPMWAGASLRGEETESAARLQTAAAIGAALRDHSGEQLASDTVMTIMRAADPLALARGHRAYSQGRMLFGKQQMAAAAKQLNLAERLLHEARSPFAHRAALFAATAEYYDGKLDTATRHLEQTLATVRKDGRTYPTLIGQIEWVIGLIEYSRGHNNEAIRAYRTALESFERAGEIESQTGIECLLGLVYRSLGQHREGAAFQAQALRHMEQLGATRRSHAVLTDGAIASSEAGLPLTALIFQNNLVAIARASGDVVSMCDALIGRGTYAAAAGDRAASEADLSEVRRRMPDISDSGMRARTLGNLRAAEAIVWRTFDPRRAVDASASAIAEMKALGHRPRLVELHLESGRSLAAVGRRADALAQWTDGLGECEHQRASLPAIEFRRSYFEKCRGLFEESIEALTSERRFEEAMALSEQSRARALLDQLSKGGSRAELPPDVTAIEYFVLADGIVIWTVDESGVHGTYKRIEREAFRRLVGEVPDMAALESLYQLLIAPVEALLNERVVIIPDGDVYRVPFAALFNATRRRYLIQDHEISVAPSLSLWLQRPQRGAMLHRYPIVLVDPGELTGASREISVLSALYPGALVLRNQACTKASVTRSFGDGAIIHFAGHAVGASQNVEPALILHGNTSLYPDDISALDLDHVSLVVLGACATADGRVGSEGSLSIARGFLAAGAQQVMGTLWPVDDAPTASLLIRFHQALRESGHPAQSLRAVQLQSIENSVPPSDWAAFEVMQTGM